MIDFLLVERKLTVLSFFLHGSFFLEYADSFNQRDFFPSPLTLSTNMSNQSSRIYELHQQIIQKHCNFVLELT